MEKKESIKKMNDPFEQQNKGQGNRKGPVIISTAIVLVLALIVAVAAGRLFGFPFFGEKGKQKEDISQAEAPAESGVTVLGADSQGETPEGVKPTIRLPGIKTEEEEAESAASENAAAESSAAETEQIPAASAPENQEPAEQIPAASAPENPEPAEEASQPAAPAPESTAQPEAPSPESAAQPAQDDIESLKSFIAGYWECELTNEEKPYLYLYFSPDYSYKMGFKSDQRLTTQEIAKSFKQEITSVRMEGDWLVIDAFFIDGDLHTVSVRRDEEAEDGIIYLRITGDEAKLTRMKED